MWRRRFMCVEELWRDPPSPQPPIDSRRPNLGQHPDRIDRRECDWGRERQRNLSLHVVVRKHVLLPAHPLKRDAALSKKDDVLIRNDEDVVIGSDGCGVVVHRS